MPETTQEGCGYNSPMNCVLCVLHRETHIHTRKQRIQQQRQPDASPPFHILQKSDTSRYIFLYAICL